MVGCSVRVFGLCVWCVCVSFRVCRSCVVGVWVVLVCGFCVCETSILSFFFFLCFV